MYFFCIPTSTARLAAILAGGKNSDFSFFWFVCFTGIIIFVSVFDVASSFEDGKKNSSCLLMRPSCQAGDVIEVRSPDAKAMTRHEVVRLSPLHSHVMLSHMHHPTLCLHICVYTCTTMQILDHYEIIYEHVAYIVGSSRSCMAARRQPSVLS
jgi:hypothetical protein